MHSRYWMSAMVATAWLFRAIGAEAACGDVLPPAGPPTVNDCTAILETVVAGFPNPTHCGGAGTLSCGDFVLDGVLNLQDVLICLRESVGLPNLLEPCTSFGPLLPCGTTVSGDITTNQQWPGGCDTFIDGQVIVRNNALLTIVHGAVVKGISGTDASLVITRGAGINAAGSGASPIVMTSDAPPGARTAGDWGGLIVLGRAPVNVPTGTSVHPLVTTPHGVYGGTDPFDFSGVLRFVRVEFAGADPLPGQFHAGLDLRAVGRSTLIDRVQVNSTARDGVRFDGGTANASHLVATNVGADGFSWDAGWTGRLQFLLEDRNPATVATGHGMDGASGAGLIPRSNPRICNATLIGCLAHGGCAPADHGIRFGADTGAFVANSIVMRWQNDGVHVANDTITMDGACSGPATLVGTLRVQDSLLVGNGGAPVGSAAVAPCTAAQLQGMWIGSTGVVVAGDPLPLLPFAYPTFVDGRYVPTAGGIADGLPDCAALDPSFFASAPYAGAFLPGGSVADNWMDTPGGWISFAVD